MILVEDTKGQSRRGRNGKDLKDGIQWIPKNSYQDDPTCLQGLPVGIPRGWEGSGMKDWDEAHGKMGKRENGKMGKWEGNHQDLLPVQFCLNSFPGVPFPLFPALSADVFHENQGEFVGILKDLEFPAHVKVSATLFPKLFGIADSGKENSRTMRRILAPATSLELFKDGAWSILE